MMTSATFSSEAGGGAGGGVGGLYRLPPLLPLLPLPPLPPPPPPPPPPLSPPLTDTGRDGFPIGFLEWATQVKDRGTEPKDVRFI